jgi:hypothetical protein
MAPGRLSFLVAISLTIGCGGATVPSPVGPNVSPDGAASEVTLVTEGIVRELRAIGLDVVLAEPTPPGALSVGGQRIDIPSNETESIFVHVYASGALAESDASRLRPDGNLAPLDGQFNPMVTYVHRQYFYLRDRVIARYGGCDPKFVSAMLKLFGSPVVVADGVVKCNLPR